MITPTATGLPRRSLATRSSGRGSVRRTTRAFALAVCVIGAVAAACGGGGATPTPHITAPVITKEPSSPTSTPADTASPSPSGSGSQAGPHLDQALEDMIPDKVGEYTLYKWSVPLSMYMNSQTASGDSALYKEWLSRLGVKAEDTSLAVAMDDQDTRAITIIGLRPTGADKSKLLGAFSDSVKKLGWPNEAILMADKPTIRVVDPAGGQDGAGAVAYGYVKDDILFLVVTNDQPLAVQAFIKLP